MIGSRPFVSYRADVSVAFEGATSLATDAHPSSALVESVYLLLPFHFVSLEIKACRRSSDLLSHVGKDEGKEFATPSVAWGLEREGDSCRGSQRIESTAVSRN